MNRKDFRDFVPLFRDPHPITANRHPQLEEQDFHLCLPSRLKLPDAPKLAEILRVRALQIQPQNRLPPQLPPTTHAAIPDQKFLGHGVAAIEGLAPAMTASYLLAGMVHEDGGRVGPTVQAYETGFAALEAGPVAVEVPVAAVGVGERGVVSAGPVEVGEPVVEELDVVG